MCVWCRYCDTSRTFILTETDRHGPSAAGVDLVIGIFLAFFMWLNFRVNDGPAPMTILHFRESRPEGSSMNASGDDGADIRTGQDRAGGGRGRRRPLLVDLERLL
jgi:hypothetical protein